MSRQVRKAQEARVDDASRRWLRPMDRMSVRGARKSLARAVQPAETVDVIAVGFFGKLKGAIAIAGERLLISSSVGPPYEIPLSGVTQVLEQPGALGVKLTIATADGMTFELSALTPAEATAALIRGLRSDGARPSATKTSPTSPAPRRTWDCPECRWRELSIADHGTCPRCGTANPHADADPGTPADTDFAARRRHA